MARSICNYFDMHSPSDLVKSSDAMDSFQRACAREDGLDPDNPEDMEGHFRAQEQEWADRGVPEAGLGNSRCSALQDLSPGIAYPGIKNQLWE